MGYEICWESDRGVVKRFFGNVTTGDIVESVLVTEADRRFLSLRYVLNDYLDVEELTSDRADIKFISALYSASSLSNPSLKIAFVARFPKFAALANEYADSLLNVCSAKTFDSLESARTWLSAGNTTQDSGEEDLSGNLADRAWYTNSIID
jgi:hypothetical protein